MSGGISNSEEKTVSTDTLVGKNIGKYEILALIGRGAESTVYRAHLRSLHIPVAFKVLEGRKRQLAKTRFDRESRLALGIPRHENVVYVYDAGRINGMRFIAMELVEGVDLEEAVASASISTEEEIIEALIAACKGLEFIHEHGIIHRDIKPHNIIVDRNGKVKITDFGIAETESTDQLIEQGRGAGTPRYMPPEVIKGTSKVDVRGDVYSLGLVLYELLTRTTFFSAPTYKAVLRKVIEEELPPPHKVDRKISKQLSSVVMKSIDKEPSRRYQSAHAFRMALEVILKKEKGEKERAAFRPYLALLLVVLTAVLALLVFFAI